MCADVRRSGGRGTTADAGRRATASARRRATADGGGGAAAGGGFADAPWEALPPQVADLLGPQLPGLADEIVEALVGSVPAYARPMRGEFGRGIRVGVEEALGRFLALVGEGRAGGERERRDVYRALGRGELRAGRSLDALQSAYRIGARVAWRRLAATGTEAGMDPATLHLLAESIFAYIDELAAESVEGYAQAQADQAGEQERLRRRVLAGLTAAVVDPACVREAAREAGWALPASAAAIVAAGTSPGRIVARLGDDVLAVADGDVTVGLWPDPEGPARAALARRGLAASAAIGWPVPVLEVSESLQVARSCLALGEAGALGRGPWFVDEHLRALALRDDDCIVERLATRRLAPLAELTPKARARLERTLLEWLRAEGHRPTVARVLGVHPQTVRYRSVQLRELLGDQLDDPDARFELELALRARELTSP